MGTARSGNSFDLELPRSLKAERRGDIAILSLARPQKRNAIDDPTAFVELEGVYRAQREAAGTADRLVQVFSSEREHSYLSDTEYAALFDQLLGWIDQGAKPTPQGVALRCDTLKARFDTDGRNGCHLRPAWQPQPLEARVPARLPH